MTDLLSPALSSRGGEGDVEPMRGFFSPLLLWRRGLGRGGLFLRKSASVKILSLSYSALNPFAAGREDRGEEVFSSPAVSMFGSRPTHPLDKCSNLMDSSKDLCRQLKQWATANFKLRRGRFSRTFPASCRLGSQRKSSQIKPN